MFTEKFSGLAFFVCGCRKNPVLPQNDVCPFVSCKRDYCKTVVLYRCPLLEYGPDEARQEPEQLYAEVAAEEMEADMRSYLEGDGCM
jgi:hypothetical protein